VWNCILKSLFKFCFSSAGGVIDGCVDEHARKTFTQCQMVVENPPDDPVYSKHNIFCMGLFRSLTSRNYSCPLYPTTFVSKLLTFSTYVDNGHTGDFRLTIILTSSTHPKCMGRMKTMHCTSEWWKAEDLTSRQAKMGKCSVRSWPIKIWTSLYIKKPTPNMTQVNTNYTSNRRYYYKLGKI